MRGIYSIDAVTVTSPEVMMGFGGELLISNLVFLFRDN